MKSMRPRRYSKRRSIQKKSLSRTKSRRKQSLRRRRKGSLKRRRQRQRGGQTITSQSVSSPTVPSTGSVPSTSSVCRGPSVDNDALAMQAHHPTDTTTPALNNINNYHLVNDRIDLHAKFQ